MLMNKIHDQCVKTKKNLKLFIIINIFDGNLLAFKKVTVVTNKLKGRKFRGKNHQKSYDSFVILS